MAVFRLVAGVAVRVEWCLCTDLSGVCDAVVDAALFVEVVGLQCGGVAAVGGDHHGE